MRKPDISQLLQAPVVTLKVGSALLVGDNGQVRGDWLATLAEDIVSLKQQGANVIVVTSGAIALGRRILRLSRRSLRLEEKQAAAATGQIALASAWRDSLAKHNINTAQILVTPEDTEARRRYLNARATMQTLLGLGAVPVVNENDTVATAEIRFGDNDRLSARVALMAGAETLVLLSDVDGLYTADPTSDPDARHIPQVETITPEIDAMASDAKTDVGTGGMTSKLAAARIATRAGTSVVLCRGDIPHPVQALTDGAKHTIFEAKGTPQGARKQWIGASLGAQGSIIIDAGAERALRNGASLLPAGVIEIDGDFGRGDAVLVVNQAGQTLAKGLSAYDSVDAAKIKRCRSKDLAQRLGWQGRDELIHRDDLVIL